VLIVDDNMVIIDESQDKPRRVSVKQYTVASHIRLPPGDKNNGTANCNRKPKKKKKAAAKKKKKT